MAMPSNLPTLAPKCDLLGRDSIPQNERVEIRAIRDDEVDALGELTVRVYESIGATDEEYTPQLRDVRGRLDTCEVLVAIDDGRVVGGVSYVPGPGPWADRAADDEAELRMLVVDPEHQGRGIGEALVRRCIELATASGKARLVLLSEDDMTVAHRLYERLGFVRAPERDWLYSPEVRLRCFSLALPPTIPRSIPHPAGA
jgi:ribosomal protein S18 acetylase RimI-like enzyme